MKFITPIILLVLSIGLFFWYVSPEYTNIQSLRDQATQYQQALNRAQLAIQKLNGLVSKYKGFDPQNVARLETFLPDSASSIDFAIEATNLVSKYNTTLKNIKFDTSSSTPATTGAPATANAGAVYGSTAMTFTVSLPYNQFIQLLGDIEQNLHFMDITNIAFNAADKGLTDYNLNLRTYYLK